MSVFQPRHRGSWFEALDPRVRLLWMMLASSVILALDEGWAIVTVTIFCALTWSVARRSRVLVTTTVRMLPFLAFLGIIQVGVIWISEGLRGWRELLPIVSLDLASFYVMIITAMLVFNTTNYAEVAASLRSAKHARAPARWNRLVEVVAFAISTGYQTVPLLVQEIQKSTEVMRSRGAAVNEGNAFEQSRRLLRMTNPLFLRTLQLVKGMIMAIFNYGYRIHPRTQYAQLKLRPLDWLVAVGLIAGSVSLLLV